MKALNKTATAIFRRIIEGMNKVGDHRKLDKAPGFMPLSVEVIDETKLGKIVSFAHYYEQNGDLMADPEITWLVAETGIYPLTYTQHNLGVYQEAATINEHGRIALRPRMQADLASFGNQWMKNIAEQQGVARK